MLSVVVSIFALPNRFCDKQDTHQTKIHGKYQLTSNDVGTRKQRDKSRNAIVQELAMFILHSLVREAHPIAILPCLLTNCNVAVCVICLNTVSARHLTCV
jgi:predicted DNA-binding helix-hairpin-helix protein